MTQLDNVQIGNSVTGGGYIRVSYVTAFTPGSVGANTATPINQTGCDIHVGEFGTIYVGTPATNAIKFGSVSCTTDGTAAIALVNPTAGALTPTPASAAAPYVMVLFGGH